MITLEGGAPIKPPEKGRKADQYLHSLAPWFLGRHSETTICTFPCLWRASFSPGEVPGEPAASLQRAPCPQHSPPLPQQKANHIPHPPKPLIWVTAMAAPHHNPHFSLSSCSGSLGWRKAPVHHLCGLVEGWSATGNSHCLMTWDRSRQR